MPENLDELALCECPKCDDTYVTEPESKCRTCGAEMQPCDIGEY